MSVNHVLQGPLFIVLVGLVSAHSEFRLMSLARDVYKVGSFGSINQCIGSNGLSDLVGVVITRPFVHFAV